MRFMKRNETTIYDKRINEGILRKLEKLLLENAYKWRRHIETTSKDRWLKEAFNYHTVGKRPVGRPFKRMHGTTETATGH